MSYLVLARKYRPQTFDEVVGQKHVSKTLTNAIESDRVAHAILFSGPRGTGKTTIARILAKALNCENGPTPVPCNTCNSCKEITAGNARDVFEIDGASNNSVDQIRELRENVKYMPAASTFKIYIIDEVHMLSTAAFNALLKTLEEPPPHVKFMFATTEPHKIPITILSRCQRHDLRRIGIAEITAHMESLCTKEDARIDSASIGIIAREADGSMRDGLSLLDQIISCTDQTFDQQQIMDILGVIDRKTLFDLSGSIIAGDLHTVMDIIDDVYSKGHDLKKLYSDLLEHLRNILVVKMGRKVEKLVDLPHHELEMIGKQINDCSETYLGTLTDALLKSESSIKFSSQPKIALEMAFVKLFQVKPVYSMDTLIGKIDALRDEIQDPKFSEMAAMEPPGEKQKHKPARVDCPAPINNRIESSPGPEPDITPLPAKEAHMKQEPAVPTEPPSSRPQVMATTLSQNSKNDANKNSWGNFLDTLGQDHPSVFAILSKSNLKKITSRSIEIEISGSSYEANRIKKPEKMTLLQNAANSFFGCKMEIVITGGHAKKKEVKLQDPGNAQIKQEVLRHPLVADALEIFDGNIAEIKIL